MLLGGLPGGPSANWKPPERRAALVQVSTRVLRSHQQYHHPARRPAEHGHRVHPSRPSQHLSGSLGSVRRHTDLCEQEACPGRSWQRAAQVRERIPSGPVHTSKTKRPLFVSTSVHTDKGHSLREEPSQKLKQVIVTLSYLCSPGRERHG